MDEVAAFYLADIWRHAEVGRDDARWSYLRVIVDYGDLTSEQIREEREDWGDEYLTHCLVAAAWLVENNIPHFYRYTEQYTESGGIEQVVFAYYLVIPSEANAVKFRLFNPEIAYVEKSEAEL